MTTTKIALERAVKELKRSNVSEPEKSAEFLLRQVLDWDKTKLITNPDYVFNNKQEKKFHEYIERRKKHEPVWYITGKIEFYGLDLEVDQNVLIPRPETEFLVEEVLKHPLLSSRVRLRTTTERINSISGAERGRNDNAIRILELGTGSGAIALSLANKLKTKIYASEISDDALKVADKNAKNLDLEKYIEFRRGDLFEPWPQIIGASKGEKFDIIVANLPYIPHEEMSSLALDIHHWEPRVALDGGKEGLEVYEKLLSQAKDYLNPNAMMFFEIGIDQGEKIKKIIKRYLPDAKLKIQKDYGDIDRIAIIKTS